MPRAKSRSANPWIVVALLFVIALINYFDRQSLSVVAPLVQASLHLSDRGYGHIVSLFLFASALAYALSGFVTDALGTRRSMAIFVIFWSLAEAFTAFATSIFQLSAARFCLGLGEPGLWVAAPKAVSEILDKKHRGLAIGIYTSGATVGAIVAIPTIIAITAHLPWKYVFLFDGIVGLIWVPLWWFYFRDPPAANANSIAPGKMSDVVRRSALWQLMIARGMTDPVWYFYLFWFPKYLLSVRHVSSTQMSHLGWIVYLAGGIGTIAGGLISGTLIRRGMDARIACRSSMVMSAAIVVVGPWAFFSRSLIVTICIASFVALAHMSWLINLTSMLLELFPHNQLGKAAGLVAAGSAVGGMISSEIIGYFVTHGGYRPVFVLMAIMHPLAIAMLWKTFQTESGL